MSWFKPSSLIFPFSSGGDDKLKTAYAQIMQQNEKTMANLMQETEGLRQELAMLEILQKEYA